MIISVADSTEKIYKKHKKQTKKMNIQEVARKYKISENFLNSKDDAFMVVVESVREIQTELNRRDPNDAVIQKLQKLNEFVMDIKRSSI